MGFPIKAFLIRVITDTWCKQLFAILISELPLIIAVRRLHYCVSQAHGLFNGNLIFSLSKVGITAYQTWRAYNFLTT